MGAFAMVWQGGARREALKGELTRMKEQRDEQYERLQDSITHLSEKTTLVLDELARRLTIIEQRYQYDGLYSQPRIPVEARQAHRANRE